MTRKRSALGYQQTLMYGRYKEDLGSFALQQAKLQKKEEKKARKNLNIYESAWIHKLTDYFSIFWKNTFARIGEDWIFLGLLGVIMALLSFMMDHIIHLCSKSRLWLYRDLTGDYIVLKYISWITTSCTLILFAAGCVHLLAPQAVGSGIPEMKTILRGVILKEYLTFRTLVAKIIGLTCTLGSGLPLGKEGPFVHVASIVATLLSKLITSFKGIYDNESRTGEMLAAACAVGVASTFCAPIGGVLFSIEVTSAFFAVRNYWRGFFAACCGATVWRLLGVWFKDEESITALFKTNFSSDFPFDPQELIVFALMGIVCGFGGAGYVAFHRQIVKFNRKHKRFSAFLQRNRFIYPGIVTLIICTCTFPEFLGKYSASTLSSHDAVANLFSNVTWGTPEPDLFVQGIVRNWSTDHTSIYFHLSFYIFMKWWTSALASTIPVPSGVFIPVFQIGAAFGRLVGETMAYFLPDGIPFGGYDYAIVPGGYAVVGAAAFSGAVTHTISTSVIVFELTGQMSHIIPVIISVLIANGVAQNLRPSIYDSIIQIKKLPFLPSIRTTSSAAYNILVGDIMVRNVVFIWRRCSYNDLKSILINNIKLQSFPLVEDDKTMILLGSIPRHELANILQRQLGKEMRLQEVQRRYSISDHVQSLQTSRSSSKESLPALTERSAHHLQVTEESLRNLSRFEVVRVANQEGHPVLNKRAPSPSTGASKEAAKGSQRAAPGKSILKQASYSYSPHSTLINDSRLRQAFETIFFKSQKLKEANSKSRTSMSAPTTPTLQRRVQLPKERVIDMSPEEQLAWEEDQLNSCVDLSECHVDAAPFQLVEKTSLIKTHSLFSMLQLNHAYVTSIGRLVGVVAIKEIRRAIEQMNAGTLNPRPYTDFTDFNFPEIHIDYETTINSTATNESEMQIDSRDIKNESV